MNQALPEVPNETFNQPNPVNETKPMLDGQYIVNGQAHSILYYVDKSDPLGPIPTDPSTDPQYNNWEAATQAWVAQNPQVLSENSAD